MNKISQKFNKIAKAIIIAIILLSGTSGVLASEINRDSVINLVNRSRNEKGIAALEENSHLNLAAREKAEDMIRNDYFAHTSPAGITPWHWIDKNEYDYRFAGENLAINFVNVEKQHQAWMDSEKHRENILNAKYQEIGVAVERGEIDGKEAIVTVQMFGARNGFVPAAQIKKIEIPAEKTLGAESETASNSTDTDYRNAVNVSLLGWIIVSIITLVSGMLVFIERKKILQRLMLVESLMFNKNDIR